MSQRGLQGGSWLPDSLGNDYLIIRKLTVSTGLAVPHLLGEQAGKVAADSTLPHNVGVTQLKPES